MRHNLSVLFAVVLTAERKRAPLAASALAVCALAAFAAGCGGGGDVGSGADQAPPPPVFYRLHGLGFSPYADGQDPTRDPVVSAGQIEQRMRIVAPYTRRIRTFGCTRGLEHAGAIARRLQLEVAMGAWIGPDPAANAAEIDSLIREAISGNVDLAVIGTEVLFRDDLPPVELIAHIRRFRREVPDVPVTTADTYADLQANPEVMAECDVIMANFYPYWEGEDVNRAVAWLHARHRRLAAAAGGREVLVAETGWPSAGDTIADAVPSPGNAAFYFQNFVSWARAEGVGYFYFEALDEKWKSACEAPQGAHWGLWESGGTLKPGMQPVFDGEAGEDNWTCGDLPDGAGAAAIELTALPPIGSFDDLRGQVWHAAPGDHGVAVYIRVAGGWWTKPHFSTPVTPISCDGTWNCDVTTGGTDELATHIAAFLIPLGYSPPIAAGSAALPEELSASSLAFVQSSRE